MQRIPTIAVIEPEPAATAAIVRTLAAGGVAALTTSGGDRGLALALTPGVELLVLDLAVGRSIAERVLAALARRRPSLPVIVLCGDEHAGRWVASSDGGVVETLVKPFALAQLRIRVQTRLRVQLGSPPSSLALGPVTLDLVGRRAIGPDGDLRLSRREFDLLAHLARNRGRVLGPRQLQRAVWGYRHDPGTNVVAVYIGYLRRKLTTPDGPLLTITTVRSCGYRLQRPAVAAVASPSATAADAGTTPAADARAA